jgi:uncharacterized protein
MNSIDQQFIEYVVKSLVGNPDAVTVERSVDEKGVLLELTVDPEDLGRVIGKRGATAQSLRTLLRALGTKNDARYNLKIVDVGGPRPPREDSSSQQTDDAAAADAMPADEPAAPEEAEPMPSEDKPEDVADATDDDVEEVRTKGTLADRTRAELADLDDLDV